MYLLNITLLALPPGSLVGLILPLLPDHCLILPHPCPQLQTFQQSCFPVFYEEYLSKKTFLKTLSGIAYSALATAWIWLYHFVATQMDFIKWKARFMQKIRGIYLLYESENASEVAQSCPTLSDPMDRSLPDSSIHGIFQARVLEWGAIAFSN